MQTPAVYDLQTEKLAFPDGDRFTIGKAGDVKPPIARPWGNRGGIGNIRSLLEGVAPLHAEVQLKSDVAMLYPEDRTATIYVNSAPVDADGKRLRSGETIVLGKEKSDLWEGYRLQVFV